MPENVFVLETDRPQRLRARWLFPVAGPPIENGVLEIQNGQITASHPQSDANTIDLGNVGLIPGLVNAHTHLEFSDLAQPIQPAKPFTSWIRALVAVRRSQPAEASAIQSGLQECWRTGATAIGEIATQDWSAANYHHSSVDCTVFREILGLRRERIAEQLEVARNWLAKSTDRDTKFVRGLSPHAPYSVHPELYQSLVELANEQRSPVAVHLAETRAELELLNQGTGEFVEMLQ
ncbi:MAG: Aminodeoxyfutalosine deaminase [Planctomycetaceae bacterium]|nr:Aminodeoxyfutalosine deaminase [Planctomycetaceae bacterium]